MFYEKKYNIILVALALIVAFFIGNSSAFYTIFQKADHQSISIQTETNLKKDNYVTSKNKPSDNNFTLSKEYSKGDNNSKIPSKVYEVIDYIQKNREAPKGYVGGRKFMNYERLLPETDEEGYEIEYQEWDVNPKITKQSRGAERLITGSNGKIYYTNNHYQSFNEVKLLK